MIRCALDSPDLGQPFRYPEHYLSMCRKFFRDTWSQKCRQNMAFWSLYKRFKSCIFLKKLLTFRFWSITSPKNVSELFWSDRKIALSLKNISDTYKSFLKCTENFFWDIFKKLFFRKSSFLYVFGLFFASKKGFSKKKVFWKWLRKSFPCNFEMLCRYLKYSSDSRLSFWNLKMVIRSFLTILSTKNKS